jgi:hypothetical protein
MKKSDVTCARCHAGYRRVELVSKKWTRGEFRCLVCDEVLEVFDGSTDVAMRLTVQPVVNAGVNPAFQTDVAAGAATVRYLVRPDRTTIQRSPNTSGSREAPSCEAWQ